MAVDLMPDGGPALPGDVAGLRTLLADLSIEVMPHAAARIDSFADLLPPGTRVFIPYPPGSRPAEQESLASRLLNEGMVPVPHLVARSLTDRDALSERLERLAGLGIRDLLLIAGDVPKPHGRFASTVDILDTGLLEHWGFDRLRFAGHPEGLPTAAPEAVTKALAAKRDYARSRQIRICLVTQFTFSSVPILSWLRYVEEAAPEVDIRIGVPGPSSVRALLSFALQCGVGNSVRALRRRPWEVTRLARHWTPAEILGDLAAHVAEVRPANRPRIHVFSFGGFQRSVQWFDAVRQGRIQRDPEGNGFTVTSAPIDNSVDPASNLGRH